MARSDVVRCVLCDAGNTEHFFDWSDAERMAWMIERAFKHGTVAACAIGRSSSIYARKERRCPSGGRKKIGQR